MSGSSIYVTLGFLGILAPPLRYYVELRWVYYMAGILAQYPAIIRLRGKRLNLTGHQDDLIGLCAVYLPVDNYLIRN